MDVGEIPPVTWAHTSAAVPKHTPRASCMNQFFLLFLSGGGETEVAHEHFLLCTEHVAHPVVVDKSQSK